MTYNAGKTAVYRTNESAIARMLVEKRLLTKKNIVLDWGCGLGKDVAYYNSLGIYAVGYDPHNFEVKDPNVYKNVGIDTITCNYVLNVVTPDIRYEILDDIYNFLPDNGRAFFAVRTEKEINSLKGEWTPYSDGYITKHNTFQKGFSEIGFLELIFNKFHSCGMLSTKPLLIEARKEIK